MPILNSKPNRAPDFKAIYGDKAEFLLQRDASVAPSVGTASAPPAFQHKALATFSTDRILIERALPAGFSTRALGLQLARQVGARIVSEHEELIDTLLIAVPRKTGPRSTPPTPATTGPCSRAWERGSNTSCCAIRASSRPWPPSRKRRACLRKT